MYKRQPLSRLKGGAPRIPGGTHRVTPFQSGKGSDWIDWIRTFHYAVDINQWSDVRARLSLAANIAGEAASMVRGIDPLAHDDLADLILSYQAVFITPADSEMARMHFRVAAQVQGEGMIKFHVRLRNLYTQAYPRERYPDTNIDLIDQFITGLRDPEVAKEVNKAAPNTYARALEITQNQTASVLKFAANRKRLTRLEPASDLGLMALGPDSTPGSKPGTSVAALSSSPDYGGAFGDQHAHSPHIAKLPGPCFACKQLGHTVADCPSKAYWLRRRNPSGQGPASAGRKGPPRRRQGGPGRSNGRVGALGASQTPVASSTAPKTPNEDALHQAWNGTGPPAAGNGARPQGTH